MTRSADHASTGSVDPEVPRGRRWGIGALRTVAWLLMLAGVWGIPAAFAFSVLHGAEPGVDPSWPLLVLEVAVATLGLSVTTWWVADWLDDADGVDRSRPSHRPGAIR